MFCVQLPNYILFEVVPLSKSFHFVADASIHQPGPQCDHCGLGYFGGKLFLDDLRFSQAAEAKQSV